MKFQEQKFPLFAVALIVVGVLLLLRNLNVFSLHFSSYFWPLIMLFGLVGVGQGFSGNRRGKIFWSAVVFLYALFFFLRSLDSIEVRGHLFIPASFLVFGLAFLMMYLADVKEWSLLIPSLVLLGIGSIFILDEYGYVDGWEVWYSIRQYWPIAIILFGIGILSRRKSLPPPSASENHTGV
jgi:hypothetical protein